MSTSPPSSGQVTLIRGRWVIADADLPLLADGAVVIRGDVVVEVAPFAEAAARYPGAAVLGSDRSVVMPGLINAHHHSRAVTWTQHGLTERLLEPYLLGFPVARSYSRRLDALIVGARLLSTGVTATVDLFTGGGNAEAFAGDVRALAQGYGEAGIRAVVAAGMATRSFLVYGEDERFVASLPAEIRPFAESLIPASELSEDDYFDVMADLVSGNGAAERTAVWFSAPGPEWVSDEFLTRIAEQAGKGDVGVQTHAVESFYAKLHAHRATGVGSVSHLDRLGILGPRFSLAHGVWLDEAEIAILGRTGSPVSHNPGSNLRTFSGVAPLNAMRAAGVTVGLGMDGTTLNDDEDMFTEMRLALRLHREPWLGPDSPTPADMLAIATKGGARLMMAEHRLGKLAPGHQADIAILSLDRITHPWVAPEADPLSLVMLRAGRQDVDTVLVAGEIVWRDGKPTRFDLDAACRELAEEVAAATYPAERAEAVRRLLPQLEAWYRAWPHPPTKPYGIRNSRI